MLGISCCLYFFCCRISLTCGALLQSRQEKTKVLISVFPSFTKPDYFQMQRRPEHSIQAAAAAAVGFVCFQKTVCRNLAAMRTLIYEDTTAI